MADEFRYNAPNFINFTLEDNELEEDDNVEAYFEYDHEITKQLEDQCSLGEPDIFYSPLADANLKSVQKNVRRSMSSDHIHLKKNSNSKKLISSNDCATVNKKLAKSSSRDDIGKIEKAKPQKYVSLAEAVLYFQKGTPVRFRSRPVAEKAGHFKSSAPSKPTIPHSPSLKTKCRQRPTNLPTREEQELLDYEESQKFKIKAHPVNQKILKGALKADVNIVKKPNTVVEPFNLTVAPRKFSSMENLSEIKKFHARPVPKSLYESPKKKTFESHSTRPITPRCMKNAPKQQPIKFTRCNSAESINNQPLTKTVPKPFSFERRDEIIKKKKDELIRKVLEEEKKAREFHAKPVPKKCLSSSSSTSSKLSNKSAESQKSQDDVTLQFKAKPPKVLFTEPFIPKRSDHPLTEICEFTLNTNKRAAEREKFEREMKEKEQMVAMMKQAREEQQKREEEQEILILRKEAEHKAQPIRKYKQLEIQHHRKITIPISPKFLSGKHKNKENCPDNI